MNEQKKSSIKSYKDFSNNDVTVLRKAFSYALFIGIVLILLSLILNYLLSDLPICKILSPKLIFLFNIIIELIKTIGIAVVIAYLFSLVSSTKEFMDFIKEKLISIVITKEFLNKMNNNERKEMVKKLIKSSEKPDYPGINEYFNKHVSQSLSLFETFFRSICQLNAVAKIDTIKKLVRVDTELRYRIYKVSGKFEKFNIGFEDELVDFHSLIIYTPDGLSREVKTRIMTKEDISKRNIDSNFKNDLSLVKESIAEDDEELERFLEKYDYIDVVNRYTEYGNDHWHLFTLRLTKPCDNLSIFLSCDNELVIKKFIPFGEPNSFNSNRRDNNKIIDIFCNDWIEPGLGVAILIAKKDVDDHSPSTETNVEAAEGSC